MPLPSPDAGTKPDRKGGRGGGRGPKGPSGSEVYDLLFGAGGDSAASAPEEEVSGFEQFLRDAAADRREATSPETYTPQGAGARAGIPTEIFSAEDIAQQKADAARQQRLMALGDDADSLMSRGEIKQSTDRMTWAEYNALSPEEKRAVDFNGLLVRAVRKDSRLQDKYDPTAEEREKYDATVVAMFGEDRGSETYAPETMAVLSQLDFSDQVADLDDFLSLKTAITVDDLARIDTSGGPLDAAGRDRLELQQDLTQATADLRETLGRGQQLIGSFQLSARNERNPHIGLLGGLPGAVNPALGFGPARWESNGAPADLNTYFLYAFDQLADKANTKDRDDILRTIGAELTEDERKLFWRYLNTRSRNARAYDLDLGIDQSRDYHSAEEFRDLLDLGGR